MKNDAESALENKVELFAEFEVYEARFRIVLQKNKEVGVKVSGHWVNTDYTFVFSKLARYFDIELPKFFDFELFIKKVELSYASNQSELAFFARIKGFGDLKLDSSLLSDINQRRYSISLDFNQTLYLKQIPIIGQFCYDTDGFHFESIALDYLPHQNVVFKFLSKLIIMNTELPINAKYEKRLTERLMNEQQDKTICWLDVNKAFSVLYLSRIGVMLDGSDGDSRIYLFLDASFSISKVRFDFYELYISTSLKNLKDISFGLSGLLVSLNTSAFSLSGGLYKTNDDFYNGTLSLKIGTFSLDALASYGELKGSNEKSFFAFCMISVPIGGPPFFYVNGFALGFGINRSIVLPELNKIAQFPLVAAARGESKEISAKSEPNKVLTTLNQYIKPESGQYFATAGIKFLTFGILESFALLSIEFGNSTKVSLLGLSTATMPPLSKYDQSIIFAELALKATFDPEQGELLIMAALTDRSFLFHPDCKLTGGFAVGFWYKGDYSGDFIVTIGGVHHPDFINIHYPTIPKLGISWIINNNTSVKGSGYFALTPSCIMAGIDIALTFELGNLRAWLSAGAQFLIAWKPFFYDVNLYVSVGASYSLKILWSRVTFKIELGANLHIWGPEFSGTARISWFIISFTISFGANSSQTRPNIQWNEFVESFIPDAVDKKNVHSNSTSIHNQFSADVNKISISNGLIMQILEEHDADQHIIDIVDGFRLLINIESQLPFSKMSFVHEDDSYGLEGNKFGIPPMGLQDVNMELEVTLSKADSNDVISFDSKEEDTSSNFIIQPIVKNAPAALWGNSPITLNSSLMNLPFGITISSNTDKSNKNTIPKEGKYSESNLLDHEIIPRGCNYTVPDHIPEETFPDDPKRIIEALEETIINNDYQKNILLLTHDIFDTESTMKLTSLDKNAKSVLFAVPKLRTIGSKQTYA